MRYSVHVLSVSFLLLRYTTKIRYFEVFWKLACLFLFLFDFFLWPIPALLNWRLDPRLLFVHLRVGHSACYYPCIISSHTASMLCLPIFFGSIGYLISSFSITSISCIFFPNYFINLSIFFTVSIFNLRTLLPSCFSFP